MNHRRPERRPVADPGDKRTITWPVKISDNMLNELKNRKDTQGIPVALQIFKAVERDLQPQSVPEKPYIPLLGVIPGGDLDEVKPETPGTYIRPPFMNLPPNAYALKVCGHSMESEFGLSIKDGFYVIMEPDIWKTRDVVHVEFSNGEFQHTVTLKQFIRLGDDKVEFRPLNPKFKTIKCKEGDYVIKGSFVNVWDGISEE